MSGTVNWAQSGVWKTTAADAIKNTCKQRFIEDLRNKCKRDRSFASGLPGARSSSCRVQHEVLHTIPVDLADHQVVVDSTVNRVNRREVFQSLALLAELAQHGPIQLHLINF